MAEADARPFSETVWQRIESDHPELLQKYEGRLEADPMLQTAAWTIMEVMDTRRRAQEAAALNKEIQMARKGT